MQNAALLKRIQHRQPTYNHLRWEEERRKNEEYLKNISQFPDGLDSIKKKKKRLNRSQSSQEFDEDEIYDMKGKGNSLPGEFAVQYIKTLIHIY